MLLDKFVYAEDEIPKRRKKYQLFVSLPHPRGASLHLDFQFSYIRTDQPSERLSERSRLVRLFGSNFGPPTHSLRDKGTEGQRDKETKGQHKNKGTTQEQRDNTGIKKQRNKGTKEQRNLGRWEIFNFGTLELWNFGTWDLWNLGTWELGNLTTWQLRNLSGQKKSPNLSGQ